MKTKTLLKTLLIGLVLLFFGCTEETIINNIVDDTDGKVNIYIEGNITNAEAQAKLAAQIGTLTENIYVQNTTQLTDITINIGNATNFRDVVVSENNLLTNIAIAGTNNKINNIEITDTKELENITINGIIEANNVKVTTLLNNNVINMICNNLITINKYLEINFGAENCTISFNHLKYINYVLREDNYNYPQEFSYVLCKGYSTTPFGSGILKVNMPELEEVYNLYVRSNFDETCNFPKLMKANWFRITCKNLNLPLLDYCKYFGINTDAPTTLSFPNLNNCSEFGASENLSSNLVNQFLHQFLNILPTAGSNYKNIYLSGSGTNAPPTGQGLLDKQTLIDQGNNVFTN